MTNENIKKEIRCTIRTYMQILSITGDSNEISSESVYKYSHERFPSITREDVREIFYSDYNPISRNGELIIII